MPELNYTTLFWAVLIFAMLSGVAGGLLMLFSPRRAAPEAVPAKEDELPMDVDPSPAVRRVAVVLCCGGENTKRRFVYKGPADCVAAGLVAQGDLACDAGCLGYGTCAAVCPTGAISVVNGAAEVQSSQCTACGLCVQSCPRKLIVLAAEGTACVACRSKKTGEALLHICEAGCLGCGRCAAACTQNAITISGGAAEVVPHACIGCGACVSACPKQLIREQARG